MSRSQIPKPPRARLPEIGEPKAGAKRPVAARLGRRAKPRVEAKRRLAAIRAQVAAAKRRFDTFIPAFLTLGEVAEALRVSKPTVVRLVRRGELRSYRPNGFGGVVLVVADSLAEHIEHNSYGRAH